ncbi:MAG: aldolase/citrate lyase family protein [Lentisphaerota bacterium]
MIDPRKSKVLDKMRAGETVNCFKLNLSCSRAVEIAAIAGFDCAWICAEHVPLDYSAMEKQVLAARVYGMDILVRVPRGSYSDMLIPLEMDASGIMIPHLMSAADARKIAWQTRFHPIGRRPADGGNTDGMFCKIPFAEYSKFINENRFVIVQIEDPEPMDELDEICSIDGIDMIFFGPGDFSQGIGAPGQMNHPKIIEARIRIAETARKHGKFAGTLCSPDSYNEYKDMGYNFLNVGADVIGLSNYCSGIITKISDFEGTNAGGVYAS